MKIIKKSVDFLFEMSIIEFVRYKTLRDGVIGSTADSDSVSRGSSPFPVVPWQGQSDANMQKASDFFFRVR